MQNSLKKSDRNFLHGISPIQTTLRRISSGRPAHAYIVEGNRLDTARLIAAALICEGRSPKPCGSCSHCRKGENHPDVILMEDPDHKTFTIAIARTVRLSAYIAPNEARRKVFIFIGADNMLPQTQNTLLKVLEDPPADASIILVCQNEFHFLATIRSRCVTIPDWNAGATDFSALPETQELALRFVDQLTGNDITSFLNLRDEIKDNKQELYALLTEIEKNILKKAKAGYIGSVSSAPSGMHSLPPRCTVKVIQTLRKARNHLEVNVNLALVIAGLFAKSWEEVHGR
jgi:hypothetical protein